MNKQIGIFGWKTGENSFGVTVPYYDFFNYFGDVHIISPLRQVDFKKFNLVVIPGGPDINPVTYGAVPSLFTGKPDPVREYIDAELVPEAIRQEVPIFGICRGHQSIAVHFGAELIQDMYHSTSPANVRGKRVHYVDVFTNGLPEGFKNLLKKEIPFDKERKHKSDNIRALKVNSLHHQSVAQLPMGAQLLARHWDKDRSQDNTIEALYYPQHNIVTVQYHPEEIWDDLSMSAIEYLLNPEEYAGEPEAKGEQVAEIRE